MKNINKIEDMIAKWLKPSPHLPAKVTKWISVNLWWIILVVAILAGIGVLAMIGGIFTMISLIGAASTYFGYYVPRVYTGWSVLSAVVAMLFTTATVILSVMAINPLKVMKKKGWDFLFLSMLLQAISVVVGAILNFNVVTFIGSILFGAVGIAISAYLLYEVRSHFGPGVKIEADKK